MIKTGFYRKQKQRALYPSLQIYVATKFLPKFWYMVQKLLEEDIIFSLMIRPLCHFQ